MFKPIPKRFLVHSISVKVGSYSDNKTDYTDPVTVEPVRVELSKFYKSDSYNNRSSVPGIKVLIDAEHSKPFSLEMYSVGDIVVYEGEEYSITTIIPSCSDKLHHIELEAER